MRESRSLTCCARRSPSGNGRTAFTRKWKHRTPTQSPTVSTTGKLFCSWAGSRPGLGRPSSARNDMQRARELIHRAVEQGPKNRYYKDSLDEVEAAIKALPRDTAAVGKH